MDFKLKSQSAMEFLILTGILLFAFLVFYLIIFERVEMLNNRRAIILGEDVATKVQKEIILATKVSDGYQRRFSLPETLNGMDYNISISGKELTVKIPKTEIVKNIPNVIGNISNGSNIIQKKNGFIYLN